MESLREIADKYGTDKGTRGPVRTWNAHNYSDVYEAYLWPIRDQPLNILEIGIGVKGATRQTNLNNRIAQGRNRGGGASLKMWAEYFPASKVFGIDINEAAHLDTDRIMTLVCDQSQDDDLRNLVTTLQGTLFDLIVDDGSHISAHQQLTFSYLFPALVPGGFYIIEDLNDDEAGVLPTRQVFRNFDQAGYFSGPHNLRAPESFADDIDFVRFHAPRTAFRLRRGWLRPFRPVVGVREYLPTSDRLAVIRKRPGRD